jgi:hypothetical protein
MEVPWHLSLSRGGRDKRSYQESRERESPHASTPSFEPRVLDAKAGFRGNRTLRSTPVKKGAGAGARLSAAGISKSSWSFPRCEATAENPD